MTKTLIVIPARLSSTRLSNKLIRKIHGREIIVWVAQRISTLGRDFVVAIDDIKVGEILQNYEIPYVLTDKSHVSGTSRVSQVAEIMPDFDYYCSVQGDEPLINPSEVSRFIVKGEQLATDYLNAVCKFSKLENPRDTANVKAIVSRSGRLIYASRALIPFSDIINKADYLQICGIYLFSKEFILNYKNLPSSILESQEKIEQLRCLELDIKIQTLEISGEMLSVDTLEDFWKIAAIPRNSFILEPLH